MDLRIRHGGRELDSIIIDEDDVNHLVRGCPKNTLVTIRDGEYIYFGIARCNKNAGDIFSKAKGRMIATNRANTAQEVFSQLCEFQDTIVLSQSGLYGRCPLDSIKNLLGYFDDIDENMNPALRSFDCDAECDCSEGCSADC
jgi:hypothetical protein